MELVYKGDNKHTYATSIAATWVWAPAIFVASSMAYFNGLYGFLWFLIPNFLTLILFGYITQHFCNTKDTTTFTNVVDVIPYKRQKILHSSVSAILNVASTAVQIIGLHTLLQIFFPAAPLYISAILVSIFCYMYTKLGGIKTCIISDKYKYFIMLLVGLILVGIIITKSDINNINLYGLNNPEFLDISLSTGIIGAIGLFSAPFVDNTFWQRVFSIEKTEVFKTFCWSSLYFLIIPTLFGLIGFLASSFITSNEWAITNTFGDNLYIKCLLSIAIFSALIATIDSNLCAIYSLSSKLLESVKDYSMEISLLIASCVVIIFEPTIIQMWLVYGTIRTAIAIPTTLIIYNKFDENRLFYSTMCAVLIGSFGYLTMVLLNLPYGYIFTIFALLFPLLGYKH